MAETTIRSINLLTLSISPICEMLHSRCDPGVLFYLGSVYIFGGEFNYTHLKSCEKIVPNHGNFPLPEMAKGNSSFCPCGFRDRIYLPSVFEEAILQALCIATDEFVEVKIPQNFPRWSPVMTVLGEELLVLGGRMKMGRLNLVTEEGEMEGLKAFGSRKQVPASCAPVIRNGEVVWLGAFDVFTCVLHCSKLTVSFCNKDGICLQINLKTGSG